MKKLLIAFTLLLSSISFTSAQQQDSSKDSISSIATKLNLIEKKSDKFNLYLNTQSSFDIGDYDGNDTNGHFNIGNIRIEARGNLTDKLFYRLRHRLNKSNAPSTRDNISKATDIMQIGYHINDKFTVTAGKLVQYWGGYEYDLNPIYVYEFSDFDNNVDCFEAGAALIITPNKNNEFIFQITNSHTDTFENIYGDLSNQNIEKHDFPLTYLFNWNGNLFNNIIKTRWAAGILTDAKDKYTYRLALGTMLNLSKFQLAFDYMMDDSELDRLGIATRAVNDNYGMSNNIKRLEDVTYNSFIAKAEYQPSSLWNIFVKGMYETSSVDDIKELNDNFRKSYGYIAGIEYIPFKDQDLRLFCTYIGRKVEYDNNLGYEDTDSYRVSLGVIYRIKAF